MQGLRSGDLTLTEPFLRFFEIVQETAAALSSVFFIDYGDGDVEEVGDLECETLNGWLVERDRADAFEAAWLDNSVDESHDCDFVSADWAKTEEGVSVTFTRVFEDVA